MIALIPLGVLLWLCSLKYFTSGHALFLRIICLCVVFYSWIALFMYFFPAYHSNPAGSTLSAEYYGLVLRSILFL